MSPGRARGQSRRRLNEPEEEEEEEEEGGEGNGDAGGGGAAWAGPEVNGPGPGRDGEWPGAAPSPAPSQGEGAQPSQGGGSRGQPRGVKLSGSAGKPPLKPGVYFGPAHRGDRRAVSAQPIAEAKVNGLLNALKEPMAQFAQAVVGSAGGIADAMRSLVVAAPVDELTGLQQQLDAQIRLLETYSKPTLAAFAQGRIVPVMLRIDQLNARMDVIRAEREFGVLDTEPAEGGGDSGERMIVPPVQQGGSPSQAFD